MADNLPAAFDSFPLTQRAETLLDCALRLGSSAPPVQALLALTQDEDVELQRVVEALSVQPALATAVLRSANSPAYGQARNVGSLQRAVMVIGMRELHDVVAGSSMMAAYARPHPLSAQLQERAVLAAAIARQLATKLGRGSPSDSYLSGLLSELGALACCAVDPGYAALLESAGSSLAGRFEAEQQRYGTTTPALGARILAASALPERVSEAAGKTGLEPADLASPLARVVAFARGAAAILPSAIERDDPEALQNELTKLSERVMLGLSDPTLLVHACLEASRANERELSQKLAVVHEVGPHEPAGPVHPPTVRSGGPLYAVLGLLAALVCWWLLTK